ncbi:hypothetical protein BDZ97DRAFT_1923172 [Flammula alnicola]|nr:hypothetical protein BDZ97DRAFT_1923172 [Flammula alnicola]
MHRFQPTRASPPARHATNTPTQSDLSQSVNAAVAPELQHLSAEDIEILEAVIKRAAYLDVLKERGLDPHEVVYYGKLLKLGTLKGKNWGDKWETVKAQTEFKTPITPTFGSFQSESVLHPHMMPESRTSDDQYSSSSRLHNINGITEKHHTAEMKHPLSKFGVMNAFRGSEKTTTVEKKFQLDAKEFPILASIAERAKSIKHTSPTITSDEGANSSPVPPSYKSTVFDSTMPTLPLHQIPKPEKIHSMFTARKTASVPHEKRKAVDLDDAWKNIRLEQDEKFADKFREDMLVARCWEMWRQGFLWITTTHQQIGEARDKLLLRLFMQRWQRQLTTLRNREDELVAQFDTHRVKLIFDVWRMKLKHRRQIAWRNDMRQKMKIIKNKSESRLKEDAWATWRQLYLAHRADAHHRSSLLIRYHSRWKEKLMKLDDMDSVADQFGESSHFRSLQKCWSKWKETASLRHDEHLMVQRIDCRIMANSIDLWRKRIADIRVADKFRNKMIMKHSVQAWKKSMNRLRDFGDRSEEHLIRHDEFLLRAIIRRWRIRMRGKRLEYLKTSLIVRDAWQIWRARIESHSAKHDLAQNFFNRTNTRLAANALVRWHQILSTHQNAYNYAVKYDETQLRAKVLLLWRLRLRDSLQSVKVARWADRFFATRRAWRVWIAAMEEKKRKERLKRWNVARARKVLNVWRRRAREENYLKQCECIMRDRVEKRILSNALTRWTKQIIKIKVRELDVADRYEASRRASLLRAAFQKWKLCHRQHVEEVSLLENHLLLKRRDVLSRAFHRWLSVKRSVAHRRLTHQHKEAQLRQLAITSAWEKWRERFKEERLRPLEYEIILANQKNVLLNAFTVWLSRTDSLPAVRFHSKHLKEKFFKIWRNAMPIALRAKKARETDRYNTLAKCFEKWLQAYKSKTTLKAVARAKFLRLPAAASRQPVTKSRRPFADPQCIFPHSTPRSVQGDDGQANNDPCLTPPSNPSFQEMSS